MLLGVVLVIGAGWLLIQHPRPAAGARGVHARHSRAITPASGSPSAKPSPHAKRTRRHQPKKTSKPLVTGSPSDVVNGVLFGGDMPLAIREQRLGRNLAMVRSYYRLGESFPHPMDKWAMEHGSTELISLDTVPGGATYAAIAAGREDGTILSFLRAVERSAVRYRLGAIYMCFEHEADNPIHHEGLGSAAQFIAAWDHIHQLAASAHLDWNQGGRLHWVLILRHVAYGDGLADLYYPGNSEVDVVAADGYNTGGCRTAKPNQGQYYIGHPPSVSPYAIFGEAVRFAVAHNKPMFIAEWGSIPYFSSSVRPAFMRRMQAFITANHSIEAALYWDGAVAPCDFSVNSDPSSFAALAAMGRSSLMQGEVPPAG